MPPSRAVRELLARFPQYRQNAGLTPEEIDGQLVLGPGWTRRFEQGEIAPSIDMLLAMLYTVGVPPSEFFEAGSWSSDMSAAREMHAEASGSDTIVHFPYADFDARYTLANATPAEYERVIRELRDGLARSVDHASDGGSSAIQTDAVARAFLLATRIWPQANHSDLWWFVVSRAYLDPFNHPAANARRDLAQSWKRTGGWALEEVFIGHYGPFLADNGITLIAGGEQKRELVLQLRVRGRLEQDKIDIIAAGEADDSLNCFGVVHVKSSFAERRTDDQPLSQALIRAGYASPLVTMDCKSKPSADPINRGELGATRVRGTDDRSAKRKDIEQDGYFSACFSYNARTVPTPPGQRAKARIHVCDFSDPDDAFTRYLLQSWAEFTRRRPS